jgi:hypothetical protein
MGVKVATTERSKGDLSFMTGLRVCSGATLVISRTENS